MNYLIKKIYILKENMEEIYIKICLKKINKTKIMPKNIVKQKNQRKKFLSFFSFTSYKSGTKSFNVW